MDDAHVGLVAAQDAPRQILGGEAAVDLQVIQRIHDPLPLLGVHSLRCQHRKFAHVVPQCILAVPHLLVQQDLGQRRATQDLVIDIQGLPHESFAVVVLPARSHLDIVTELVADLLPGGLPAQVLMQNHS